MDFFADDLFTDIDMIGDPLDMTEMPPAEMAAGPEWYSDLWFADPGLPNVDATDVPLPDPFQSGVGGVGLAGALGSRFARRGSSSSSGSSQPAGNRLQTAATITQIADTAASLGQRLAAYRRKRQKDDDES
jgi:hypothetical protein